MRERLPVTMLRLLHSAPGDLILPSIDPGTKIALEGLGRAPIRFEMPRPPVRVTTHTYRSDEDVPGLVRSVHIDADAGRVRIVYGYMFPYAPARAPEWIRVAS